MKDSLGYRIANTRDERDLTQTEASKKVKVKRSTWSLYESNNRIPSLSKFKAICRELDVSPNYLLGFTDEMKSLKEEEGKNVN